MAIEQEQHTRTKAFQWLIVSALITVMLWQIPYGNFLLYPFTILSTWFHEMGHGLTAILTGGRFESLLLFPNGSGLAYHSGGGAFWNPLVAAGGLLGPPIAGALFILSGRNPKSSRRMLVILGLALLFSTLIWVRSLFGWIILPVVGLLTLAIAFKAGESWRQVYVQFLGVQACISTYRQLDYLFMPAANVGGQQLLSDTGQIAAGWLLPYWFWGTLIALTSLVLLVASMRHAYRRTGT